MATLAKQAVTRAGLSPSYAACSAGGDKVAPDENTFLHVKNADASSHTVTVVTPGNVDGMAIADLTVTVPAGGNMMIGPLLARDFSNPADGLASITYSAVTSMTVAALSLEEN